MMNSQNNPTPCDIPLGACPETTSPRAQVPFYLDTLDPDFVAWITSLDPQDKELFADMLHDTCEMTTEGYENPDIRRYIRRTYGGPRVY